MADETTSIPTSPSPTEYPLRADLRQMMRERLLPTIAPGTVASASMAGNEPTKQANVVLDALNCAIASGSVNTLAGCFLDDQAYWQDQLAMTYHLRTFFGPDVISQSFLETNELRRIKGRIKLDGAAAFIVATPLLQFIDCSVVFRTSSPAATCRGRLLLLPVKHSSGTGEVQWKIWSLSTRLESLDLQPEDESLLEQPSMDLNHIQGLETDVFIIGAGNAAIALAARLKALGVGSVMAERNANVGDNWALRYDSMRFHLPTSFCDLPYMAYDKDMQTPNLLSRDDLASQVRRYVAAFGLNVITSAQIRSTQFDPSTELWHIEFETPAGRLKAVANHLVQATGIASQKPYTPEVVDRHLYQGISIHSIQYKNAGELKDQGVKSVLVVGSANTGFDILQDAHAASLTATLLARSPTYIIPLSYVCSPLSLGAYDAGVQAADQRFFTIPTCIDAQLAQGLFAHMASQEPDRYTALAEAGFPVVDSRDPGQVLFSNVIERAGGHYIDIGGTDIIARREVGVIAGVEVEGFTATGVRLSDGRVLETDAVIWCTGFADRDVRSNAVEVLGGEDVEVEEGMLGPKEIASRVDATWGVDAEGEIRGTWKRHRHVENYWVMGGHTQQHRWHSRTLALQIKAALKGVLPPAYRETPAAKVPR